jgi:alginate O-acetyltransferase complex protein AlgI
MIISFLFFIILIASAVLYWSIPYSKLRSFVLPVASLLFIFLQSETAFLIVVVLTLYTYLFAILIEKYKSKKLFHRIGVMGILGLLIIFKYSGLLVETINDINRFINLFPRINIELALLPLGISYITFKHISYLTDIYWELNDRGSFINFLCYSSLFTIFIAGPIERFGRLNKQLDDKISFKREYVEIGFERIVLGMFKKLVIADWLGYFLKPIIQNRGNSSNDFFLNAIILLGFSFQIYMDFSGYSDIAIGSSRLFGLKIMENFNYPYLQPSIAKFWRSWHISLSEWIRDYIFYPLQDMGRSKMWLFFAVPVISFGICGLWHGASWNFLFWGVAHGTAISFYQFWQSYKKKHPVLSSFTEKKWFNIFSIAITYVFVTFCWLFFI